LPKRQSIFSLFDTTSILLYLALLFIGFLNIYAAIYDPNDPGIIDFTKNHGKQLIWIASSTLVIALIFFADPKLFSNFAYPIYFATLILLIGVLFLGTKVSGSTSWFSIGSIRIQPSEFAKFATALALAKYITSSGKALKSFGSKVGAFVVILIPAALILLQGDLGSALVYSAFILVLYREGLNGSFLVTGLVVAVLCILALVLNKFYLAGGLVLIAVYVYFKIRKKNKQAWISFPLLGLSIALIFSVNYGFNNILKKHHQDRIEIVLGLQEDLQGVGYNLNQSMIAIGSGGFAGKGYLQGTQTKFDFVPEQSTDFIFCTVGEEWGFLGSIVVLGLFLGLLIRILLLAEKQRSNFSRVYGYGVASIIFFHFFINIGMTIGLVPVIGIPLPFLSYGGSSLWAFTLLLFIFLKLDSERKRLIV
jgi:rod shape determining protein RodA